MSSSSEAENSPMQQNLLKLLVLVLWLITSALGFYEIILVHSTLMGIIGNLYGNDPEAIFKARYTIGAIRSFSFIIFSIIWVLFFVFSTNYHYKHATKPRSWKLLIWSLGVELVILVTCLIIINV